MVQRTLLYIFTLYIYGYVHIPVIEGCIRVYKYHRGYNVTIALPGKWKLEKIYCTGRPRRSCCEAGTPALDTQFPVFILYVDDKNLHGQWALPQPSGLDNSNQLENDFIKRTPLKAFT